MIGTLKGTIEEIYPDHIILDVCNVGYTIYISTRTLNLCKVGNNIKLYIHNHNNRDNLIQLYGFLSKQEQDCLSMLIKVNGISCKIAMSILNNLTPNQLLSSIINNNKIALKVGGIGTKLIERIINELHSEVSKMNIENDVVLQDDSLHALVSLGYEKNKAYNAINNIKKHSPNISTQEIICKALKELT